MMMALRKRLIVGLGFIMLMSSMGSGSADAERSDRGEAAIAPVVEPESCPSYPPGFDDSEAGILAYEVAEPAARIPGREWDELKAELQEALSLVRRDFPFVSDIHAWMEFYPSVLEIDLADDLMAKVTEILNTDDAPVTLATGHAEFDALNTQFGLRTVGWGSSGLAFCYHLGLDHNAAISAYSKAEGVASVGLSSAFYGDDSDIFVEKWEDGEWHITFREAWGDCPSGCIYEKFHGFLVANDGVSLLYGGEEPAEPLPVDVPYYAAEPGEPARPNLVGPEAFPRDRVEQLLADASDFSSDRNAARERPVLRLAFGGVFRDCEECPELVVVPAGSFMMGSRATEAERDDDEGPTHGVLIGESLAVGRYEVTREEFGRFVAATGHHTGDSCWILDDEWQAAERKGWADPGFEQTDRDPAVCVSWEDAQAYVRWLSWQTGEAYRLLTESEWEYVARGGTSTARHWGETETGQCRYANGADLAARTYHEGWQVVPCDDGHYRTAPAGSYTGNWFGLHDVLGNVWEWTQDCWNADYKGAPSDGRAWVSGDCSRRVVRGGSWFSIPSVLRSADRGSLASGHRLSFVGFRVARSLGA